MQEEEIGSVPFKHSKNSRWIIDVESKKLRVGSLAGDKCLLPFCSVQGDNIPSPALTFEQTGFPEQFIKKVRVGSWCKTSSEKTRGYPLSSLVRVQRLVTDIRDFFWPRNCASRFEVASSKGPSASALNGDSVLVLLIELLVIDPGRLQSL